MQIHAAVRDVEGELKGRMVLLHGLGSNEEDMFGLACELDENIEVICLRAPFEYGPGFAWFDIGWSEDGVTIDEKQFSDAVDLVAELLPQIGDDVILGGFSQGGMITAGVISKYPQLVKDAVILSGRGPGLSPAEFKGRVFQAHGLMDDVIAFRDGEELRQSLAVLGDRLEFHGYPMGHTVCPEEIEDLNAWLKGH